MSALIPFMHRASPMLVLLVFYSGCATKPPVDILASLRHAPKVFAVHHDSSSSPQRSDPTFSPTGSRRLDGVMIGLGLLFALDSTRPSPPSRLDLADEVKARTARALTERGVGPIETLPGRHEDGGSELKRYLGDAGIVLVFKDDGMHGVRLKDDPGEYKVPSAIAVKVRDLADDGEVIVKVVCRLPRLEDEWRAAGPPPTAPERRVLLDTLRTRMIDGCVRDLMRELTAPAAR